jgi:fibronectin type 3 domain-containing protein
MSTEQKKIDLINELIDLENHLSELWRFHPDNPTREYIVEVYQSIASKHQNVENQLKELN